MREMFWQESWGSIAHSTVLELGAVVLPPNREGGCNFRRNQTTRETIHQVGESLSVTAEVGSLYKAEQLAVQRVQRGKM